MNVLGEDSEELEPRLMLPSSSFVFPGWGSCKVKTYTSSECHNVFVDSDVENSVLKIALHVCVSFFLNFKVLLHLSTLTWDCRSFSFSFLLNFS